MPYHMWALKLTMTADEDEVANLYRLQTLTQRTLREVTWSELNVVSRNRWRRKYRENLEAVYGKKD